MNLYFDLSPQDFLKNATPQLEKEASLHSFILSLVARYGESKKPVHLLARGVDEDGNLLVAGVQTEDDRSIIVSRASIENAQLFAHLLADKFSNLPGVTGPSPSADEFAKTWSAIKRCPSKLITDLRLFALQKVTPPAAVNGFARPALPQDKQIIFDWLRLFHAEAAPDDPKRSDDEVDREIDEAIAKGQFFVWEDGGKIVCFVGSKRETPTERWIGPVYTPLDLRGRGYASALTADVSQRIVNSEKKAILFTDLANPTSNSIYQKVGYQPLADFRHFFFS